MNADTPSAHRLQIDWTRCDGHGLCQALASSGITADEWGFPVLHPSGPSESDARRVVAACPSLALRMSR